MVNPELVDSAISTGKYLIEGKTTPVALTGSESDRALHTYTVLAIKIRTGQKQVYM